MPRKSAAQTREPASLPEVPIPLSEVPAHQRSAYEIALIDNPDAMKAALSQEDFFPMLANFPEAWWERMSLYLYRRPDDEGRMVKNEGPRKYVPGGVLRQPVDEEFIAKKWGGGKYTLYLKLDSKETLREHTFVIDGTPKVLPGQFVEIDGKPVSVGSAMPPPTNQPSETTAQMIAATSAAATSNVELVTKGIASVMEMQTDLTRKQLGLDSQPKDPLDTVKTLLEIMRVQQPPAGNSMKDALEIVDRLDAMAARRNPAPAEVEEKETPIEQTLSAIKELSGGMSLAELMKPAAKAAAADPIAGWAPIVSTIGGVVGQFLEKFPMMQAHRNETLRLEYNLRVLQMRQPGQALPELPAATAQPAPQPQPRPQAVQTPTQLDPAQVMNAIVAHIVAGFKKPPVGEWGEQTAAAMDFHFSDAIDAMGIADTLGDPEKVNELVAGIPVLAELSKDARWKMFQEDVSRYCADRWGNPDDEKGKLQSIDGEKPPAA